VADHILQALTSAPSIDHLLPELQETVQKSWPYPAEAFLATSGGYNAIYTVLHAFFMPGSYIAIEDPTALRLLDTLEDLGARILPVKCDEDGPLPASLAAAMTHKPAAFLFQPRLLGCNLNVAADNVHSLKPRTRSRTSRFVRPPGAQPTLPFGPTRFSRHSPDNRESRCRNSRLIGGKPFVTIASDHKTEVS
jgi:hypothetical protein